MIVAKVCLQSKPPPGRHGKPFKSFIEVMRYIAEHEGLLRLFKGIGPQITKGLIVQGLLMMTKERYVRCVMMFGSRRKLLKCNRVELLFILLLAYIRKLRDQRLNRVAAAATAQLKSNLPFTFK